MNKNGPQRMRMEDLLAQDEAVSSFQFKEFRMNLEESIKHLQERAHLVHKCALCSLGLFIACVVLTPVVALMERDWIQWTWSACGLAALFVTGVLAGIDFYKYRPVLKRKQRDVLWAAIDQLQHDVAELKARLTENS
jgi:hypothetical protein